MRFAVLAAFGLLTLAACQPGAAPLSEPSGPALAVQPAQAESYIVVYRPHIGDARAEIARHVSPQGARVYRVFQHALRGWAGDVTAAEPGSAAQ